MNPVRAAINITEKRKEDLSLKLKKQKDTQKQRLKKELPKMLFQKLTNLNLEELEKNKDLMMKDSIHRLLSIRKHHILTDRRKIKETPFLESR